MTGHTKGIAKQRQDPLRERYRIAANEAYIVDSAKTVRDGSEDPFHSTVAPGDGYLERHHRIAPDVKDKGRHPVARRYSSCRWRLS